MGIQGLLPVLKPIQKQKHLSEFAGQTLAVDAYVWLHRGAYACATELATRKTTRKYVDYCMHRVRLLRHHGIVPFVVFDGGPLPAKQGTEKEREKKRADNLEKANALAAQGKDSQARDYYVKCVDVTPQMAYQVVKALKAENVLYVVAPYEADAQLAYLERAGFVDGIITEDSDLLVFGCKNVLFKLDTVASTITSVSRSDFGSPALASESLSLVGWSDTEFRWMAMMSGCDYLPSIPGIGLKTAWQLLKKCKSVDKAVRAIRLQGRKDVPRGYLESFKLAEKVFLHQRVYDPGLQKLVYLTDPSDDEMLDERAELYIGRDLEPSLAKRIAEGDACPISLKDMEDINTSFKPRAVKTLPLKNRNLNTPTARNTAEKESTPKEGILSFFKPVAKDSSTSFKSTNAPRKTIIAGRESGKRTLVDAMEQDVAAKRKKFGGRAEKAAPCSSRFFIQSNSSSPGAGLSKTPIMLDEDLKENVPSIESGVASDTSEEGIYDPVAQEDGYLSPSPSLSRNVTPDLSSPVLRRVSRIRHEAPVEVDDGKVFDSLSSPELVRTAAPTTSRIALQTQDIATQALEAVDLERDARVLVRASTEPPERADDADVVFGPDLQELFMDDDDDDPVSDGSSEIACWDDKFQEEGRPIPTPAGSVTPPELTQRVGSTRLGGSLNDVLDADDMDFDDNLQEQAIVSRYATISRGWRERFSFGPHSVHPAKGRSTPSDKAAWKAASTPTKPFHCRSVGPQLHKPHEALKPRRSDPFPISKAKPKNGLSNERGSREVPIAIGSDDCIEEIVSSAKGKLCAFRFQG